MKYKLPDGRALTLRNITDAEYDLARVEVCPTCGGREERIPDSGVRAWKGRTYRHNGVERNCDCAVQIALYRRYLLANIGTQYMRLDWKDFAGVEKADQMVKTYLANWRSYLAHGYGLTFASKSQGVGKTWAATHIGKELIKESQKVYFLDFVQMVDAFCGDNGQKQSIEDRMRDTTFLILDDVRAGVSERQNDLYALKFEVVIRHRTNFDLPTFLTTNLTEGEFEQEFPRIYSLSAPKQMWIEMNGVDHRKKSDTAIATMEMIERGEVAPIT